MKSADLTTNRRRFLFGSGSILAMTALPLTSQARSELTNLSLEGIVAYRESDRRSMIFASILAEAGMTLLPLATDPVRQWRDQVKKAVHREQVPMYGLTDWSDFLLMKELNAELRRFPVREDKFKTGSTMDIEFAAELAMKKIQALTSADIVDDIPGHETDQIGNLFSWEIR